MATHYLKTRSGRRVSYAAVGCRAAPAVLFCHGAPGSALGMPLGLRRALSSHYVLIPERPGYGASEMAPRQARVRDWVDDADTLLATMGVDRLRLIGYSGGAAFALACAHDLGAAVTDVLLFSPIAPLQVPQIRQCLSESLGAFYAGAADNGPALLDQLRAISFTPAQWVERFLAETADPDQVLTSAPDIRRALIADFERAFANGYGGWVADLQKLAGPWGFSLADITVPVRLWYGSDDRNTPPDMARYLSRVLPNATAYEVTGQGHLFGYSDLFGVAGAIPAIPSD